MRHDTVKLTNAETVQPRLRRGRRFELEPLDLPFQEGPRQLRQIGFITHMEDPDRLGHYAVSEGN
ncbi:MAG: hypothetical protein ABEH59_09010 [Halobacteriales archaeon]